jgi:hypothetical protein
LARSKERELALFTAADIGGVLRATTAPIPRWATENDLERRPGGGHPTPATREKAAP